jgi:polar amino acid transport system substrate-binding protein
MSGVEQSSVQSSPLRVGITPNFPPVIFKQAGKLIGVEVDFANLLSKELNRPVEFIQVTWKDQIKSLQEGRTDIIMSGMSITEAREVRIDFTSPYMRSGLMAAMRSEDAPRYNSVERIFLDYLSIGVVKDTTSDVFVQHKMPKARRIPLSKAADAVFEFQARRIDLFIHDAPSIVWLVAENEADLKGLWKFLNEEHIAWGVRKGDDELLTKVNAILERWREDGTLQKVLVKWLPYFKETE